LPEAISAPTLIPIVNFAKGGDPMSVTMSRGFALTRDLSFGAAFVRSIA
jgi:hypothetical protein